MDTGCGTWSAALLCTSNRGGTQIWKVIWMMLYLEMKELLPSVRERLFRVEVQHMLLYCEWARKSRGPRRIGGGGGERRRGRRRNDCSHGALRLWGQSIVIAAAAAVVVQ